MSSSQYLHRPIMWYPSLQDCIPRNGFCISHRERQHREPSVYHCPFERRSYGCDNCGCLRNDYNYTCIILVSFMVFVLCIYVCYTHDSPWFMYLIRTLPTDSFRYQLSCVLGICLCKNFCDPCVQKLSVDILNYFVNKNEMHVICRTSIHCTVTSSSKWSYVVLCWWLSVVCCLVVEFCDINQKEYLILASGNLTYTISVITILGLLFLLYPLVGHLTDVYMTRYRSLKWSFGFLILAACIGTIYEGILIAILIIEKSKVLQHNHWYLYVVPIILFLVYIIGLGLFQANAIQFGLDQLLEAPTPKLISFIHWYTTAWAQNFGSLLSFCAHG